MHAITKLVLTAVVLTAVVGTMFRKHHVALCVLLLLVSAADPIAELRPVLRHSNEAIERVIKNFPDMSVRRVGVAAEFFFFCEHGKHSCG